MLASKEPPRRCGAEHPQHRDFVGQQRVRESQLERPSLAAAPDKDEQQDRVYARGE